MRKFLVILPALLFFVIGIITLSHYGFNFDEPYHFSRGQMYLHYFLTGEKTYKSLKPYPRLNPETCKDPETCKTSPPFPDDTSPFVSNDYSYENAVNEKFREQKRSRRSFFQHDLLTFDEIVRQENGHPAFGGIVASLTNYILYQKLGLLNDTEAYHIAELFISALIVLGISIFTYKNFGIFASVIAAMTLAMYPLFFSESRFNIKDPIETSFFGLSIILFYFGIVKRKWLLIVSSAVVTGFALGTKFNAVFLPFIIAPWLLIYIVQRYLLKRKKILRPEKFVALALIFFPIIVIAIFVITWPYLWSDPLGNVQKTISFYRSIGSGTLSEQNTYLFGKFNLFPLLWITTTTPIVVLFLSSIGIIYSILQLIRRKQSVYLLILLWCFIPIARVSLPNSAIYGGIRHILEFFPALAILSGIGAATLLRKRLFRLIGCIAIFMMLAYPIIKYHPNENLYFNSLIGGLKGATQKKVPYAGNSYGNAYLQGVEWLNKHAEPNARLGLPIATMANVPRLKLRSDISFNNGYWSGPKKEGEYEMEVTYDQPQKEWYSFTYYDAYLDPVYELKVDDVTILKIWKNDLKHTREKFKTEQSFPVTSQKISNREIIFDTKKQIEITRITIEHGTRGCTKQIGGNISLSVDGNTWLKEYEPIDFPQVPPDAVGWDEDTFVFLFPGKKAKYVKISTGMDDSCILESPKVEIRGLKADNE